MKNIFSHKFPVLGIIALLVLFSGCEDKVTYTLDLKATLKGTVTFYDDLGYTVDDDSALIEIIGDEVVASAYSGEDGAYEITNIPTGTYDVRISKEPYEEWYLKCKEFVGGDVPTYYTLYLKEQPQITFSNLKAEFSDDTYLTVTANVFHNYDVSSWSVGYLYIMFYNAEDVSLYNYTNQSTVGIDFESGSEISVDYNASYNFSSGETIYIVACGRGSSYSFYWDPIENKYIYYGYSEPSEVISIVVP